MGIKNLTKFINEKFSHVPKEVHLSVFAYKIIAIDLSLYLYTYKAVANKNGGYSYGKKGGVRGGNDSWLISFLQLVSSLRRNNIHCIFIYDGKPPVEKEAEQQRRKDENNKREVRAYELQASMDEYHQTGIIKPNLQEFIDRETSKEEKVKKLLNNTVNMNIIAEKVEQYANQGVPRVTEEDIMKTKKLFTILKVPFCTAPEEAESMCAKLCRDGKVDAVLSEDSDILAYGAPIFINKINTGNDTCKVIQFGELLQEMDYTPSQFLDFCIMCGSDYNSNIRGIGPVNAYKLISSHSSIEEIENETGKDVSCLNHVRVRELFNRPKSKKITIPYCGKPNFDKLREFLAISGITQFNDKLEKSFYNTEIVIEDDEGEKNEEDNNENNKGKETDI